MATVELESPGLGWVGSVGFTEQGELAVLTARDPDWQAALTLLLARMITEPAPSGRVLGSHVAPEDPDLLYELAEQFVRRKPVCLGEHVLGYVAGGDRWIEPPDEAEDVE